MSSFAGTGSLVRLHLRHDRWRLLGWIAVLAMLTIVRASNVIDLHPTQESLDDFARIASDSPAAAALNGPPVGLGTIGGRVSYEILVTFAVTLGLLSTLVVTRHTRAEEQVGRTELVRSRVVGRHAPPMSAMALAAGTNLAIAVVTTVVLVALGLPVAGSALLAAAAATVGILFAAVAAVTAQLTAHSRSANGIAGALLGAAFAIRAVGDSTDVLPSWLSPIGWAQASEPFGRARWWPLLVCLLAAAAVGRAALWLGERRDVGSAMFAPRPGPGRARAGLVSPLGLAVRLHRGAAAGWLAGVTTFACVFGLVGVEIEQIVESAPSAAELLADSGGTVLEGFMATVAVMLALLTSGYVLQGVLRMRAEESEGRAEVVLATSVNRMAWVASHVLVVASASTAILALSGAAMGLVHGLRAGQLSWVVDMATANLAHLPAVWVLAALTLLLVGTAPHLARMAWVVLAAAVAIAFVAGPAEVPQWVRNLSPFTHVPPLPAADLTLTAPTLLLLVTAALGAIGLTSLRRRDLEV